MGLFSGDPMRLLRVSTRGAMILLAGCNSCSSEYNIPDEFVPSTVQAPEDHGAWLSMDVTPDGERLAIAFYDRTKGALGFAIGDIDADTSDVTWTYERVDGYADSEGVDRGDRGKFASMKVAPDGTVWVAYQDINNGVLNVAHRIGYTWTTYQADPGAGLSPQTGEWASLDINASGLPVIVHQDADSGTLRRTVAAVDGTEVSFTTEEIWSGNEWTGLDAEGLEISRDANVGMYARLMIVENTEYIAFYDKGQQKLNLLEGAPGGYVHTVVTTDSILADRESEDMGAWPSIVLDGSTLSIAFQDVTNQDLVMASREGGATWTYSVIDDGEFMGADTELFRYQGELSVLYFDGYFNNMMIADRTGAVWVNETLGGETTALGFHNEYAKVGDRVFVASYDYTERNIFVRTLD